MKLLVTHFVFVPGGKRTKEDFDRVRALLEADGHQTDALTLSDPEKATLSDHIEELCDRIEKTGEQRLHLVGHSYAGFVISGAADRMPEKVERLVFLDTLIPESGKSLLDFFASAGIDPADFGVPDWPPFAEKLVFDRATFKAIPKTYIHCLASQFLVMTENVVAHVKTHLEQENWTCLEIEADHYCMIKVPELVAKAIVGDQA
ncbi:alpha/beta hydrolase [uncultured Roseibium sp.]|uniref:alpha/beta fold hydrolase n=1 Tax=uncultured Roseibium sp. TaxID=1936171 RepID=UPI00260C3630|nr:alpha/beta hydrolase [uncultured Roseibium sp.]